MPRPSRQPGSAYSMHNAPDGKYIICRDWKPGIMTSLCAITDFLDADDALDWLLDVREGERIRRGAPGERVEGFGEAA